MSFKLEFMNKVEPHRITGEPQAIMEKSHITPGLVFGNLWPSVSGRHEQRLNEEGLAKYWIQAVNEPVGKYENDLKISGDSTWHLEQAFDALREYRANNNMPKSKININHYYYNND